MKTKGITKMELRDFPMEANSKGATSYGQWCKEVEKDIPGAFYEEEERKRDGVSVFWCRVARKI